MSSCSLFLCLTWLLPLHAAEPSKAKTALHTAALESQKLRVVVADNEAYAPTHQAGYNGVAERDDPEGSVLRLEMTPGKVEWVLFNPSETTVAVAGQSIRKPYEYLQENAASK